MEGVIREGALSPLNKYDTLATDKLSDATDEEVLAHSSELLGWLQDSNWPVYKGVLVRLRPLGAELVNPICAILKSDDSIWKFWIVRDLISSFEVQIQPLYFDCLRHVIQNATQNDYEEGLIDVVESLLSNSSKNV